VALSVACATLRTFDVSMYPRDFSKQLRRRLADGITLDDSIRELRDEGASIIECIVATKTVRSCDLGEAKRLIHDLDAWADVIKRTDAMWDELEDELKRSVEPADAPE
jgi:hypothetical protein